VHVSDKNKDAETGVIRYDYQSKIQTICYTVKDMPETKTAPRYGDKVSTVCILFFVFFFFFYLLSFAKKQVEDI
jgi:hypothetical protein